MHLSDYVGRPPAAFASRLARPTPAAGPLPRGYIDTGDLVPTERAQRVNRAGVAAVPAPATTVPPPPTRLDVMSPGYLDSMQRAARSVDQHPQSFPAGRTPALPAPDKTVYASLNRPDGMTHSAWRSLTTAVGRALPADWIVQRVQTDVDAEGPMVLWVLLVPVDRIVDTQDRLRGVLAENRWRTVARLIWAEATPRWIGGDA